jgi:hypothetical protein
VLVARSPQRLDDGVCILNVLHQQHPAGERVYRRNILCQHVKMQGGCNLLASASLMCCTSNTLQQTLGSGELMMVSASSMCCTSSTLQVTAAHNVHVRTYYSSTVGAPTHRLRL